MPLRDDQIEAYSVGLVCMSICADAGLTREEIETWANLNIPTGISSRWAISEDERFHDGRKNPSPCDQNADGRIHYLLNC